jgi:hypothetical protein
MNRPLTKALTLGTTLALALVALPARADHDRDHDRDGDRDHRAPVAYPVPAAPAPVYAPEPVYAPAPAPAPAYPVYRVAHWRAGWRDLQEDYHRLDVARDRFYASWHGNTWRRDRFEAWYASRRAELDRRASELRDWRGRW